MAGLEGVAEVVAACVGGQPGGEGEVGDRELGDRRCAVAGDLQLAVGPRDREVLRDDFLDPRSGVVGGVVSRLGASAPRTSTTGVRALGGEDRCEACCQNACGGLLALARRLLGVGQPRVVGDRVMQDDVAARGRRSGSSGACGRRVVASMVRAWPNACQPPPSGIRPSFLMSTWTSSPGCGVLRSGPALALADRAVPWPGRGGPAAASGSGPGRVRPSIAGRRGGS